MSLAKTNFILFKTYIYNALNIYLLKQIEYERNIFISDKSKFITSKVSSLSLKSSDGKDIEVSGLEHPIEIRLENQEHLLQGKILPYKNKRCGPKVKNMKKMKRLLRPIINDQRNQKNVYLKVEQQQ